MLEVDWNQFASHYSIRTAPVHSAIFSAKGEQLLEPETAIKFLELYADSIKAHDLEPACTYFGARIGMLCTAVHEMMSFHQSAMDLQLSNLTIQLYGGDQDRTGFAFVLGDTSLSVSSDAEDRKEWRHKVFERFYGETVRPLIESVAEAAKVNPAIIWALLPTGVYYRYDRMLEKANDQCELYERISEDFIYMTEALNGELFGRRRNPFHVYFKMIPDWRDSHKQLRQKAGCCLYYRTEGGTYCYTCPKMNKEQRMEIGRRLQSEQ